jgi:hypothetical protein
MTANEIAENRCVGAFCKTPLHNDFPHLNAPATQKFSIHFSI